MSVKGPKLWQVVKLLKNRNDGEQNEYISKVLGIEKDDYYILENPTKNTKAVLFLEGSKMTMSYLVENKNMNSFEVELISKFKDENIPLLKFKRISDISKIQRRNYYRLDISMYVILRKEDDILFEETNTLNLSGGGMKIITKQKFEVGDTVLIDFKMGDIENNLRGKIVKIDKAEGNSNHISVEFLRLKESKRNEIIRFIFKKQREELQKGMISND